MTMKHITFAGLVALLLNSATFSADAKQTENLTKARQAQLMHLLKQDCGSCHGMTLKGGLGPALLPENLEGKPALFLTNTIMYGRPGTAMPPWKEILTEQEAKWITKQLVKGVK
ncbi:cytochrome c [Thalassotalea sp. M1531]|uniref:Cytochrome c n=1 Tax=Thalassotalea algicola TaxID=2716224 RepID=A0A7Y0LDR9_9GAMM|nr:cytochrome c [Thalassotalea algicola]NMP31786.1 cytochrome c [Thalassotalea algicola]